MTPQERAERMARTIVNCGIHEWSDENELALVKGLTAQIEEAEREAVHKAVVESFGPQYREQYAEGFRAGVEDGKRTPFEEVDVMADRSFKAYHKGFNAAREKAKGIVEDDANTGEITGCSRVSEIAQRIGEMEP